MCRSMYKLILAVFLLPLLAVGQASRPYPTEGLYRALLQAENTPALVQFGPTTIPLVGYESVQDAVKAFYKKNHPVLQSPETDLQLLHAKKSIMGSHLYFQQLYKGVPIIGATLKVNMNAAGVTLSVFDKLTSTENWTAEPVANAALGKSCWLVTGEQSELVYVRSQSGFKQWLDSQGNTIREQDTRLYYASDDTLVAAKVFRPDPLTPIGVIAGQNGTYKHFNDSDYAMLNDQRVEVTLPVTYNGSVFQLQNKYARIYDTSFKSPNIAPATSTTPQFYFTRKQNGFKDVMALYHVTNTQEYLHSLGINEVTYQLKIDAHSSTSDQSFFEYDGDTTLNFGEGGVPDAEDADVIVHEFTHAVSFSINPCLNMSSERRAIEEATCDVMAAIYSKRYAPFNWRKLFNWDAPNPFATGVNPFWNGRNGNSTKNYSNLTSDSYGSSEIWTSTLLDVEEQIGSDSTVLLMLTSLASYSDNTTMPQAAQLFMQADSVLLNKYFAWKIGPVFNARLLGNFPTGIQEQQLLANQMVLRNTQEFLEGTGNAVLAVPVVADVCVYDIQGRVLQRHSQSKGNLSFNPADFTSGMYIVRVTTPTGQVSLKLLKN